jgi:hypothetical protein
LQQIPLLVIGLRSIGTSLAAAVATGAGAQLPVTLRPAGHPFHRELRVGPRLEQWLLSQSSETEFAIVDEGPGLSGSSFGATADWLEDHGIARERMHFFPGHAGNLGPVASVRHRQRWQQIRRHLVPFEVLLGEEQGWFAQGVPGAEPALNDMAAGQWRRQLYAQEQDWPPANTFQERRKYLFRAQGRTWLAKFVGLGRYGAWRRTLAQKLAEGGFGIAPLELRRGFLVSEWIAEARTLHQSGLMDRSAFLAHIARYLAFRQRELPALRAATGATPAQLLEMSRVNIAEGLGQEYASRIDPWRERLTTLSQRVRPVVTDNRLQPWEWLVLADGRILKADATDHCLSHDCIGMQDLAWDLAGAIVEFDLAADERQYLERQLVRRTGRDVDPEILSFHLLAYLAFQLGYYTLAAQTHEPALPGEAARLGAAAQCYAGKLRLHLDSMFW